MDLTLYQMIDLQMSRAGALEATLNTLITLFAIYLSIVTGYLVVAYMAGSHLTRVQVVIAAGLFLFASFTVFFVSSEVFRSFHLQTEVMWEWAVQVEEVYAHPNNMNRFRIGGGFMLAMLYFLGLVVPLYFMWSIRHHKKK